MLTELMLIKVSSGVEGTGISEEGTGTSVNTASGIVCTSITFMNKQKMDTRICDTNHTMVGFSKYGTVFNICIWVNGSLRSVMVSWFPPR